MSKKHFIRLAEYLMQSELEKYCQVVDGKVDINDLHRHLADFCHEQNHNFMRDRWLGYIRGENGKSGGQVKAA